MTLLRVDLRAIDRMLDGIGDDCDAAARPAAQAASQVLYDRVKQNVGSLGKVTGNLDRSIYQVYSQDNSGTGRATYHISWNHRKAPHGHLVEFGHIQRYKYYKGADGKIRPMVKPEMMGKPAPGRNASQAQRDAYYVALPTPIQVPAKSFVRNAQSEFGRAYEAAEAVIYRLIA